MKIYIPEPIAEAGEKYLEFQGYEIFRGSGQTDRESLIRDIAECDAMILRTAKMDEEVLEDGKKLRIVARHGAGYDNLDVKAAKERGIITTYSPDTTALSVAEMTITLLLMLAKKVMTADDEVDRLFDKIRQEIIEYIAKENGDGGEDAVDLIMVAKYLERIGDHATNIAEWVEFSVTGNHRIATEVHERKSAGEVK